MPAYKIETTYHLPVYRQRSYEADTLEEACRAAIADEGWDDGEEDVDTSGESAAAVPAIRTAHRPSVQMISGACALR